MTLKQVKSKKCSYEFLFKHLYHLDCSMGEELLEGIETLRHILKYNSYAELSALFKVGKADGLYGEEESSKNEEQTIFSPEKLLYFAWAGCEGALVDINKNLNSQDGEILFITAISLAHLNQEKGFTLLNALCANKAHVIMNEDDIYLLLQDYIHYVQHPKAREIEGKYLTNHPNNLFLQ